MVQRGFSVFVTSSMRQWPPSSTRSNSMSHGWSILEPGADLGARGRFRDKRDVESGEPPVLAVDEDVPIDPPDLTFRRLPLVLLDQSLKPLAVDVRQAGIVRLIGFIDSLDERHGIAVGDGSRSRGTECNSQDDSDD